MKKETTEELLKRIAKDFVPRDPDKVTMKNGHRMMKPYYNGFMQEKHLCNNGKPCYEPSHYSLVWHSAVIQCKTCGQRYIMADEGWLLISGFKAWLMDHAYSVTVILAIVVAIVVSLALTFL